jgi:hypothetical protein
MESRDTVLLNKPTSSHNESRVYSDTRDSGFGHNDTDPIIKVEGSKEYQIPDVVTSPRETPSSMNLQNSALKQ